MKKVLITLIIIAVAIAIGIVIYKQITKTEEETGLITIQLNEVTRSVFYAPQYVYADAGN